MKNGQTIPKLTDMDLMPYGMHKDKQLGKVPADYLLYLYAEWQEDEMEAAKRQFPGLVEYIEENLAALALRAAKKAFNAELDAHEEI